MSKTFHGLEDLLKCTNKIFDIVLVSETRITKKTSLNSNINLQNYSFEFMPTESNAGGTLPYIANHWSHKPRTDLNLNIVYQMESNFIEKINSRKSNIIVGCLYKHLNVSISDFNQNYLNTLLDKLSKKNKQVFLYVPDNKCYKQKWFVLVFTRIKLVALLLACMHQMEKTDMYYIHLYI